MTTLIDIENIRAIDVRIDKDMFYVVLNDDREIGVPYAWYWRLAQASLKERKNWSFISGGYGIHREDIDEDISIAGILNGIKNTKTPGGNFQ